MNVNYSPITGMTQEHTHTSAVQVLVNTIRQGKKCKALATTQEAPVRNPKK